MWPRFDAWPVTEAGERNQVMESTEPGTIPKDRVLLKVSGEALLGDASFGIDPAAVERLSADICEARDSGTELCLVVGGGNIFRGLSASESGLDRVVADQVGMLATVMNALATQSALEARGVATRVLSAIPMSTVCEPYIRRRAIRHLERGRIVICAAGTGNPYFTTDTAAVLRAIELGCGRLLKATQVDGVYDSDPGTNPEATRYDSVSYTEVLTKHLRVMDSAAIALARDNDLPVTVFNLNRQRALVGALDGSGLFTTVSSG